MLKHRKLPGLLARNCARWAHFSDQRERLRRTIYGGSKCFPSFGAQIDISTFWSSASTTPSRGPISRSQNNLQEIIDKVKNEKSKCAHCDGRNPTPLPRLTITFPHLARCLRILLQKMRAALVPYLLEGVAGNPSLNLGRWHSPECSRSKDPC